MVYPPRMNSWEETMAELVKLGTEAQPQTGQVWVLREDATIRRILDPEDKLPKKVVVSSVDPPDWNRFTFKVLVRAIPEDITTEINFFEALYELHRPSVWERITQRT
jgi:hypothetical protein